jgi:hypothetical protein
VTNCASRGFRGFENRRTFTGTEGSNPLSSAGLTI